MTEVKDLEVMNEVTEVTEEEAPKKGFFTKVKEIPSKVVAGVKKHKKLCAVLGGVALVGTGVAVALSKGDNEDGYSDTDVEDDSIDAEFTETSEPTSDEEC